MENLEESQSSVIICISSVQGQKTAILKEAIATKGLTFKLYFILFKFK